MNADIITNMVLVAILGSLAYIFFLCIKTIADKVKRNKAINDLYNYEDIQLGMRVEEMLDIMGDNYNKSSLKDGSFKYEWRVAAVSKPRYGNSREYSGVKKVSIYVKDGVVVEIKPYNV